MIPLLVLSACAPPADVPVHPAHPDAEPTDVTAPSVPQEPAFVWTAGDLVITNVSRIPDVDGDGTVDLLVDVRGHRWVQSALVVTGPLLADLVLPEQAAASIRGGAQFGDANGDGLADAITGDPPRLILGPLAGLLDPETTGLPLPVRGGIVDIDGDGRVDFELREDEPLAESVWTEWETWGIGEPSLRVRPPCGDWRYIYDGGWLGLQSHPDLDGDGVGEVWLGGKYGPYDASLRCSGITFPQGHRGTYDPSVAADAASEVPPFLAVGDQTGDGIDDVLVGPDKVLAGPVRFVDGAVDGDVAFVHADAFHRVVRAPFDLDGDGIGEWVEFDFDRVSVLTGGPGGGVETGMPVFGAASTDRGVAIWKDGRALVLALRSSGDVAVYDLGPADPSPVWPH